MATITEERGTSASSSHLWHERALPSWEKQAQGHSASIINGERAPQATLGPLYLFFYKGSGNPSEKKSPELSGEVECKEEKKQIRARSIKIIERFQNLKTKYSAFLNKNYNKKTMNNEISSQKNESPRLKWGLSQAVSKALSPEYTKINSIRRGKYMEIANVSAIDDIAKNAIKNIEPKPNT